MTTGGLAQQSLRRLRWETLTGNTAILQEDGFRRLWTARLLSNTALNAVLYTMLVLAVGGGQGSGIKAALFITAYLLPTALLATVSGVVVDRLPKNLVLAGVSAARLGLMLLLLMSDQSLWVIYVVALLLAVAAQFSAPAEIASVPQVVRPDQLTTANSVSNLGGLLSQVVGFAVLPAVFLNLPLVGPRPLFFVAAVLFGFAGVLFLSITRLGDRRIDFDHVTAAMQEVRKHFAEGWDTLGRDFSAYMSVIIFVLASTASLVAVTLMPKFVDDTLGIPVRHSIFIFLPAALGILAGLRLVQWLEFKIAKGWLVAAGFGLLAASLIGLTLTSALATLFPHEMTGRLILTIVLSTAAAFSFSVVGVASRSLVNERLPVGIQGRVFAAQFVLTNLASIPPILFAGVLAELVGVEPVMFLFVLILLGAAGWSAAQAAARPRRTDEAGAA